jgi:cytochrome b-561 domain containing protein 2
MLTVHLGGSWSGWGVRNVSELGRLVAYDISPLISVLAVFSRIRLFKLGF